MFLAGFVVLIAIIVLMLLDDHVKRPRLCMGCKGFYPRQQFATRELCESCNAWVERSCK